jgi:hypothetical protein
MSQRNNKYTLRISTNNIATGMVRGGRKIRFRPPKIRFYTNIKLPTNATGKSEKIKKALASSSICSQTMQTASAGFVRSNSSSPASICD